MAKNGGTIALGAPSGPLQPKLTFSMTLSFKLVFRDPEPHHLAPFGEAHAATLYAADICTSAGS
jgi:hypothetical protein